MEDNLAAEITQIEKQLLYCREVRGKFRDTLRVLEAKLSPVLMERKEQPELVEDDNEMRQELVPLAKSIREIGEDIEFLNNIVRDIIERLGI